MPFLSRIESVLENKNGFENAHQTMTNVLTVQSVSKIEAGIIQILREFGMMTFHECFEKLKQNGVKEFPDLHKLKNFLRKRPNLFIFYENADTIWLSTAVKNLDDKEMSALLKNSGLCDTEKIELEKACKPPIPLDIGLSDSEICLNKSDSQLLGKTEFEKTPQPHALVLTKGKVGRVECAHCHDHYLVSQCFKINNLI